MRHWHLSWSDASKVGTIITSLSFSRLTSSHLVGSHRFANKKVLVVLYGFLSLVFAAAGSYFNATITTIEKRYKISSKNMGIISVGNDVSSLFLSAFISYYGGKSHRPRLIGLGLFMIVLFCLINSSPHFLYGPGDEALSLTIEYGGVHNDKQTDEAKEVENRKLLCRTNGNVLDKDLFVDLETFAFNSDWRNRWMWTWRR